MSYSPGGHQELDTTERLSDMNTSLYVSFTITSESVLFYLPSLSCFYIEDFESQTTFQPQILQQSTYFVSQLIIPSIYITTLNASLIPGYKFSAYHCLSPSSHLLLKTKENSSSMCLSLFSLPPTKVHSSLADPS